MSAKVDTIFATFIRRISYLPCKEFGLTDEFIAQNTRRPEEENVIAEDSDQTLDQSKVDDSSDLVDSDETKVDNFEDADIGLKRDAGDMSEVPGLESEVDFPVVEMPKTLESTTELQELKRDLFPSPWIMSQSAPGEVAAEEPDELGESTTGFEDTASCTGVDFGTDSDFEVSTSSGSTRGRPKKNKWRQKAAGGALKSVEKKTNVSKEKEIDLERERILDEVLPMQFRTCFLCGLGCEFCALDRCDQCLKVFHNPCVKDSNLENENCCVQYSTVGDLKPVCRSDMKSLLVNDHQVSAFKMRFISTPQRYRSTRHLIQVVENSDRSVVEVPSKVKEMYTTNRRYDLADVRGSTKSDYNIRKRRLEAVELQQKYFNASHIMDPKLLHFDSSIEGKLETTQGEQKLPQAVLVLVDKDFNEVITQINIYGGVFSVGTSRSRCDFTTTNWNYCRYISQLHCRIYYSKEEHQFELLNYSPFGVKVDDVLYCYEDENLNSKQVNDFGSSEVSSSCRCEQPLVSRAQRDPSGSRLWDGAAVLSHGSTIQIGCANFVFVIP
ncbi:uncharacterized protein LOC142340483 [Convolutriloba macropyga]|uniref:uncharacterized protein LOC142340483 n=1 Tax=Convolutriloba macropyga TaxID=536237 RepID=UPI003F523963